MNIARLLVLFALGTATVGCDPEAESHQRTQPVVGGTPSSKEEVVRLVSSGEGYPRGCTGTMVAPNLVLTARHCVSVFTDGEYRCTADGTIDEVVQQVPATAGDMGLLYSFDEIAVYVGAAPDESQPPAALGGQLIAPATDTICRNDVAFVVLDRDLDLPIRPVRLGRVVPNEDLTVVGFGINDVERVERHEKQLSIVAVGESEDFPMGGNALPRTFSVGSGPCHGDSGGPAISDETGEVVGVYSMVRGTCTTSVAINVFTHVGSFDSIVREAFAAAGHEEMLEPSSGAGGSTGQGGEGLGGEGSGAGDPAGGCVLSPGVSGSGGGVALLLAVIAGGLRRRRLSKRFGATGV